MSTATAFGLLGGVLAVILSFFLTTIVVLLALVVIVLGVVGLVQAVRARQAKGPAITAIVLGFVALCIAGANSDAPTPAPVAPAADPTALPATATIAAAQSPADLVTTDGRRLHVALGQAAAPADACRTGSDLATATRLVANQQVSLAAPDAARLDGVVPAGSVPAVVTLADGRDYAEAWRTTAADGYATACEAPEPAAPPEPTADPEPTPRTEAPVTTEETAEPDVDVDRADVPAAPRTKAHTGHSGHPCLPGERDGDHDGYCGE